MRATAWNNGSHSATGAGYGLRISRQDRDRFFDPQWRRLCLTWAARLKPRPLYRNRSGDPVASCVLRTLVDGFFVTTWRHGHEADRP
jgi:hypothetical protein